MKLNQNCKMDIVVIHSRELVGLKTILNQLKNRK